MLRLDRHPLGPRVFAFGRRIHEWHLGVGVLALAVGGHAAGFWPMSIVPLVAATAGARLVAKDRRALLPPKPGTTSPRGGAPPRAPPPPPGPPAPGPPPPPPGAPLPGSALH